MIGATLNRRMALAGLLATAAAPPLSSEDLALAQRAAAYLQGLKSARARFVQMDARGNRTSGEFWLQRPGRARFQYDPPSGLIVASDGRLVSVLNPRLKSFQNYPLRLTPLSVLLGREIRLGHGFSVDAVTRGAGGFSILAHGAGKTEGRIALDFADKPLALTGWTITDAQGGQTRVRLVDLRAAGGFDQALFDIRRPPTWGPPAGAPPAAG